MYIMPFDFKTLKHPQVISLMQHLHYKLLWVILGLYIRPFRLKALKLPLIIALLQHLHYKRLPAQKFSPR